MEGVTLCRGYLSSLMTNGVPLDLSQNHRIRGAVVSTLAFDGFVAGSNLSLVSFLARLGLSLERLLASMALQQTTERSPWAGCISA